MRVLAAVSLSGVLGLSGCGRAERSESLPANAVAVVGTQVITADVFKAELAHRALSVPARYADPKEKKALLDEMVRMEVLHQRALSAGYDKDPEIAARLKRMIVTQYQKDQLAKLGHARVDAEDIADYYRGHPERFGTPEKVRVALIELRIAHTATAEKRAEMAEKARALLAEANTSRTTDGTFGLLAQTHSENQASRYRGGDIGWLTVGDTNVPWAPALLAAIFQLAQPGDLAPVIETPTVFYLVKLVERRSASMRPLEEVKDGIEYLVFREKEQQQQEALYAELKQGFKIRTNQALLESIELPARKLQPPGLPAGPTAQASDRAQK